MNILLLLLLMISIEGYAIDVFPSGITVSFVSPTSPSRKNQLLQKILIDDTLEQDKDSLKTDRIIRVINALPNIPPKKYLAVIFYNQKKKKIGYHIITNTPKPSPLEVFFIDRNTGRQLQGLNDIYQIPKKTVSFGLAFVDKKGRIKSSPFTHPDFDENGHISLKQLFQLTPVNKNIMLQYEITGTYESPHIKLSAFHFVS